MHRAALVSDFDGTITGTDFFTLIADRYMPGDGTAAFEAYRRGEITHVGAMQTFFRHAPTDNDSLEVLLRDTDPDVRLAESFRKLEESGWQLIIVSAGSSWYIERILAAHGLQAVVHSNPGRIVEGCGLQLELAASSPFFCPDVGVNKSAVVQDAQRQYGTVAFAGDGAPDVAPALLVPPDLRFARRYLAEELTRRGESFREFAHWSDIVDAITA